MSKTIWIAWAIRGSVTILAFAGLAMTRKEMMADALQPPDVVLPVFPV